VENAFGVPLAKTHRTCKTTQCVCGWRWIEQNEADASGAMLMLTGNSAPRRTEAAAAEAAAARAEAAAARAEATAVAAAAAAAPRRRAVAASPRQVVSAWRTSQSS
jgi:hypothetical protein